MFINLIADDSVGSAPSGFIAAVEAAANIFDSTFSDNITVNIRYGWGTENNVSLASLINARGASGNAIAQNANFAVSYSTLKSWLSSSSSALPGGYQATAVSFLPASNSAFPNSANSFFVSSAQEKALGQFSGNPNAVDGAIGFGTASSPAIWEVAALHEIAHALGRDTNFYERGVPTIMDLFRFDSAGQFEWTGGQPAYLSIDGGRTALADFDTIGDYGDFIGDSLTPIDPFNLHANGSGLTTLDVELMDVLGFHSAALPNDFNGDGNSDLVFQNNNGQPGIWLMHGATPISEVGLSNPGPSWHIVASRDVNGDGAADLIWQNSDGTPGIWLMNGATPIAEVGLPNPGTFWHLVGTGDLNGDSRSDLLWQGNDGTLGVWLMNGSSVVAAAGVGNPGANWKVIGAADYNADGRDDILLQNTATGNLMIDLMNGTSIASSVSITVGDPSWHAVSTGVFNGTPEIAWQNSNGTPGIWLMNGTAPVAEAALPNPGPAWQLISVDHFTPDGQAGLLFQNTNGAMGLWEMNGTNIVAELNLPNPGAGWQSVNGHPFASG
jgi:FG-GAP-like repeat